MRILSLILAAATLTAVSAPAMADTMMKPSPKPTAHAMKSDHMMKSSMKGSSMKSTSMKSSHMKPSSMKSSSMHSDHMMKASPKPTSKP